MNTTEGFSFAEVDEMKNLLIMHYMENQSWDWNWALRQLEINRADLSTTRKRRSVGFTKATSDGVLPD